jgi:hypothetical protein
VTPPLEPGAASDLGATAVSIACPGCRRLVDAGAPCPWCGRASAPAAVARDLTVVLEPAPDVTMELDPVPAAEPLPPAPVGPAPAVPAPPRLRRPAPGFAPVGRRRPGTAVLAGAGAAVVVAAVAVAGLHSASRGDPEQRTAATGGTGSPAAGGVPVPAGDVRAAASSTQHRDGAITYTAANTLDGRPETAWNSDGQGAGAVLTYTFAAPVDLTSITVLNGYQKTRPGRGGTTVDLFALNQRARAVRVVTDAGSAEWTLRDDRAPQTLSRTFGRTRSVRLQVVSTYPSSKYDDLAISEVRFTAAP